MAVGGEEDAHTALRISVKLRRVKRLVATATRAILGARALLADVERGGTAVDRSQAARGFARRLEAAITELPGTPVVPAAIIERLAGKVASDEPERPETPETPEE